jgi:hypothetical protein
MLMASDCMLDVFVWWREQKLPFLMTWADVVMMW